MSEKILVHEVNHAYKRENEALFENAVIEVRKFAVSLESFNALVNVILSASAAPIPEASNDCRFLTC